MSLKIGIELEFVVFKGNKIVPAKDYTRHLEGSGMLGEIRTSVCPNLVDAIFELKKLLWEESEYLASKRVKLKLLPSIKASEETIKYLRENIVGQKNYSKERSIYPNGLTGKVLFPTEFKASLQINMSHNTSNKFYRKSGDTFYETTQNSSQVFDYIERISKLDEIFSKEIKDTNRVPGVYSIKEGNYGTRVEYRSLPNNINLNKLLKVNL